MLLQVILEGLGLGALLVLVCAVGICKGAVGMVHLYSPAVQQRCVKLGLTTHEKIKRNSLLFKAVCVPGYISYVLVCVYGINGARSFAAGFWQLLVILSVMNLIDRFLNEPANNTHIPIGIPMYFIALPPYILRILPSPAATPAPISKPAGVRRIPCRDRSDPAATAEA